MPGQRRAMKQRDERRKEQPQCKHIVSKYLLASLYWDGPVEAVGPTVSGVEKVFLSLPSSLSISLLGNRMKGSTLYHSQYVNLDEGMAITCPAFGNTLGSVIHSRQ